MQKKYILAILILFIAFSWWIYAYYSMQDNKNNGNESLKEETQEADTTDWSENSVSDTQKKIDELRKRYAVKWIILEGENYLGNDLYALALRKFLEAAKENPNDSYITKKIAESYFEMHKYTLAYKYYNAITWKLTDEDKERKALSLIYQANFSKSWSLESITSEIKQIWFSENENFYYLTSLSCLTSFHECKKVFWEKLFKAEPVNEEGKKEEIVAASGTLIPEKTEIESKNLVNIKRAIETYNNFQSEDISYKDALILWAFVQNKMYPVAIELWKKLLEEKSDYKPILKIIAQAYFEMGNYTSAKTYLEDFIELDQKDKNWYYFMWVIQYYMREFILSNIFLWKALDLGYEPQINIKRRMIYNYYELNQTDKMLSELRSLIYDEKEHTEKDLYLSIYYHIIHEKLDIALEIAQYGLQKFKDNWEIYGYIWLIQREKWELEIALENFNKWLELNSQSPFILLNIWQLYVAKWEKQKSIIYFKKTIKLDKWWEFWKQASIEIEALSSSTWSTSTGVTQ